MRTQIPKSPPEIPTVAQDERNLLHWLSDPRAAAFFGTSFALKAAVLACLIQRGNLSGVARAHGVTRAAASKQGRRAQALFGNLELTCQPQ